MSHFIAYRIIPEKELIVGYVSGKIVWKDVIAFKNKLTQDKDYDASYNILDDIRNVYIDKSNTSEIQKFIDFARNSSKFKASRKSAILTTSPNQVVNSMLLESLNVDLPINFNTFSSLDAALEWMDILPKELESIALTLDEMALEDSNTQMK